MATTIASDKLNFTTNNNEISKPKSKPKPKLNIKILTKSNEPSPVMSNDLSSHTITMDTSASMSLNSTPTNSTFINTTSPTSLNVNNSGVNTIDSTVNSLLKSNNMKNVENENGYVPSKKYSKKMKEANKVLLPLSIKRARQTLQPSCTSATIPPKRHFFEYRNTTLDIDDTVLSPNNSPLNKEYPLPRDKKIMNKAKPTLVINNSINTTTSNSDNSISNNSRMDEDNSSSSLAAEFLQQQKQTKDSESILTASEPYKYGPICILPYLYLGCEENAADKNILHDLNIGALLNVAYEVNNPFIQSFLQKDSQSFIKNSKITDDEIDIEMIYDENAITEIDHKFSSEVDDEFDKEAEKSQFITKTEMSTVDALRDLSASLKRNIRYKKFYWHHNQDHLSKYFDKAFDFINESRNRKRAVLVSCQQGVSRSASLIIAYIMKALHLNVAQAYAFVKLRNPHISPNLNLMNQLTEFEKTLFQNSNYPIANCNTKNHLLYKDFQKLVKAEKKEQQEQQKLNFLNRFRK
ncbi:phosphatases II [Neocallimastix lanati (nom. inval.)]|jgi:protein-tyrosine phosphatase|uniref:protein-tyrosine-phosphatase n=1 Tax=Neocallimastix californiae TaxID=1754190 RepID=A0A1Y2AKX8_9FUNG|nr:phosphatases II [Neocallimastix sp. JGI-2020a]ORY23154.1 phosphatases II [Neocallimastix californiae]|eukprot:ORY23154.1 phosphatases II [Neocallimastix californiae]